MPLASAAAIVGLVVREEWRGRPRDLLRAIEDGTPLDGVPAEERALVAAAAALGAGEPKRALRLLADAPSAEDTASAAAALRGLAHVLDRNWFPGGAGAVLEAGDLVQMQDAAPAAPETDGQELVFLVSRLLALTPTWRSIARGGAAGNQSMVALQAAIETLQQALATPLPRAAAPAALTLADVFVRAGQFAQAGQPLGTAMQLYQMSGDAAGVGACKLAQGDWSAEPVSHPETLGEDLEGTAPGGGPVVLESDPGFAEQCYEDAAARFRAADAPRGLAAVELRRARLLAAAGGHAAALDAIERAQAGAEEAGDGALARLAAGHAALMRLEGGDAAEARVGDRVAAWATDDGSTSFARGLSRLCHAKARRWREQDRLRPARAALEIADRINAGIGAASESDLVRSESVALYGGANYRSAALVLSLLDLDDLRRGAPPELEDVVWIRAVERCVGATRDAMNLTDPDLIERVETHVRWLLEHEPPGTEGTASAGPIQILHGALEEIVAQNRVFVPLYRGRRARDEGEQAAAEAYFEHALAATREAAAPVPLWEAVVLGTIGRREEAVDLAERLQLPADFQTNLYVRLKRYDLALRAFETLDAVDAPPSERPWEMPAVRAAALVGAGRPEEALPHAETAIAAFEQHLAGLARDVLRTMATDDVVVADLYTTAVRAHVERIPAAASAGGGADLAAAFELSDRCRGSSLGDLVDLDSAAGEGAAAAAVRRWLGAGAALARMIEGIAARSQRNADSALVRARLAAAERELDDAEIALDDAAPGLLAARRRLAATPPLDEIQARLGAETLLLQYHVYDDRVVAWAVTCDRARVSDREASTSKLAGRVAHFHRATAMLRSSAGERAALAAPLAELLLAPFADALEEHRRVVVVPHGILAMLPFHLLPFGDDLLCAKHVVSYLPAASLLVDPRPREPVRTDAGVLVVGDPAYGSDRRLPRLPGARTEAVAVAARHGVEPLVDERAVRASVLGALESAHLVHLATHGSLRAHAPYSAELALAGDESLTVPDLMAADTSIDLAVLSACDSGRGGATASGDLVGLTRALIAAGARQLVVSLWPVDDQLACLTMTRFHEELAGDVPAADALAAAQRAMRKLTRAEVDAEYAALQAETATNGAGDRRTARDLPVREPQTRPTDDPAHPAYWAPFVHIGG